MSWTVAKAPSCCVCTPDGSSDLDLATYYPDGIELLEFKLVPSAANDAVKIREEVVGGTVILELTAIEDGEIAEKYYGWSKPYIKNADCTFSVAANAKVVLKFKTNYGDWPS